MPLGQKTLRTEHPLGQTTLGQNPPQATNKGALLMSNVNVNS